MSRRQRVLWSEEHALKVQVEGEMDGQWSSALNSGHKLPQGIGEAFVEVSFVRIHYFARSNKLRTPRVSNSATASQIVFACSLP